MGAKVRGESTKLRGGNSAAAKTGKCGEVKKPILKGMDEGGNAPTVLTNPHKGMYKEAGTGRQGGGLAR